MAKQNARKKTNHEARRPKNLPHGQRTYKTQGKSIVTHSVGAMPIINRVLKRTRLKEFLAQHLPKEDKRTKLDTPRVALLLLKNVLVSREPMYGVAEWGRNYAPDLLELRTDEFSYLNDDRVGRCLDRICKTLSTSLVIDVVRHVTQEFGVQLDELHNDSTTITFFGDKADAETPQVVDGQLLPTITWGHNKDHRPDLKQLLYILTVSDDGGVPVYFQAASGNTADDTTHLQTWKTMAQLVERPDFVYVADCKLASTENLREIDRLKGRFVTVLPATRKEDRQFRERLRTQASSIPWSTVDTLLDEQENVVDVIGVCNEAQLTKDGFRLFWFHSQRKASIDQAARTRRLQRAIGELTELKNRMQGQRTRLRKREKVEEAVDAVLDARSVRDLLRVDICSEELETFRQTHRGRPTSETTYRREVVTRFDITWEIDTHGLADASTTDGVFPLITNISDWEPLDVLRAYKRQPIIEKRFTHLKTDFKVAPVFLQSTSRIVGLLTIYFFALMVQSLLERELRLALANATETTLPLYPEGRACARPTTRQVLDVFDPIARHTLRDPQRGHEDVFTTELAPIHRQILDLLRHPKSDYHA